MDYSPHSLQSVDRRFSFVYPARNWGNQSHGGTVLILFSILVMKIDSHQHFWKYAAVEYPWIQSDWPLRRDFLPEDLEPLLKKNGLDACVAVQARQTLEETRWLL